MRHITMSLFLLVCFYFSSAKGTIFMKYEANSCIQQYHYQAIENTEQGKIIDYFDFHISLDSDKKAIVRTQLMGTFQKSTYSISNAIISCQNTKPNTFQSLAGQVVNGEKDVYFVEETTENYHIYKGMNPVKEDCCPKLNIDLNTPKTGAAETAISTSITSLSNKNKRVGGSKYYHISETETTTPTVAKSEIIAFYDKKETIVSEKTIINNVSKGNGANTNSILISNFHKVIKGETLYSLSKKYNVSVEDLKSWNHLNDNIIEVGDELIIF